MAKKGKSSAEKQRKQTAGHTIKVKKIFKKTKTVKAAKSKKIARVVKAANRRPRRTAPSKKLKLSEPVNANRFEQEISGTKFAGSEIPKYIPAPTGELPDGYGEDKIIAQVRDPWWLHVYWEVRRETIEELRRRLRSRLNGARAILRVYDISLIHFNGTNAHHFFDIEISFEAKGWYINVAAPGRSWCVDIGFRLGDGSFVLIARSNMVTTPLDGPSGITDEEWMIPDDKFARLYGMGFGFGPSSPKRALRFREWVSSHGLFSVTSPVKDAPAEEKKRNFWFRINTELIVHGATEPDAKVKVCGRPVKLDRDGTFSLRFSLPDGKQAVPVEAQSPDGLERRTFIPVVSRETRAE